MSILAGFLIFAFFFVKFRKSEICERIFIKFYSVFTETRGRNGVKMWHKL